MYLCNCLGSFLWRNNCLRNWMAWRGSFMTNQVGSVVTKNIWGEYHVVMSWYYVIILWLCCGHVIPKNTPAEWKKSGLRHAKTSMDRTSEVGFLGRVNVDLDVWYSCYAYVVYVVHVASMMCALVVLCIHSMCTCYAMLCTGWYK